MKKYQFRGQINGAPAFLARLDKRRARSLFEMGGTVYLVPSNFVPFGAWITPCPIKKDTPFAWSSNFDTIVKEYSYYNCINNETGYFPAYYINLLNQSNL